jgi:hypothetical protein
MIVSADGTLIRTFRMADRQAQMLVAGLLNGMSGLSAHHRDADGYVCLVVECASILHANNAANFVRSIDPKSVLVRTTNCLDVDDLQAS